jgi:hypothetical protein
VVNKEAKFWAMIALTLSLCGALLVYSSGQHQLRQAAKCAARWNGSRYPVTYDKVAKCRVQVGGVWVPEANVRVGP